MIHVKTTSPEHDYSLCVHKGKRIELYDYTTKKPVWNANLTSLC